MDRGRITMLQKQKCIIFDLSFILDHLESVTHNERSLPEHTLAEVSTLVDQITEVIFYDD